MPTGVKHHMHHECYKYQNALMVFWGINQDRSVVLFFFFFIVSLWKKVITVKKKNNNNKAANRYTFFYKRFFIVMRFFLVIYLFHEPSIKKVCCFIWKIFFSIKSVAAVTLSKLRCWQL